MLEVNSIDLHYGAAQALRGVSLQAEIGQVTCVLGRNGVGKTSLLRALIGQHAVSRGTILWEGSDIRGLKPYERARRGIAYVPQGREIFPLLTVEENLKVGFAPAAARRAHRGHSALDHQGYRPRDRISALAEADGDRAGRAVPRFRARSRRPFHGIGSRHNRL